ncbi:MAG: hypothetical protein R3B09_10615, partial [Nannocystaceae bacterium]
MATHDDAVTSTLAAPPSTDSNGPRSRGRPLVAAAALLLLTFALVGCAAGDPRFSPDAPAGFWIGIWHGMISWVSLIV